MTGSEQVKEFVEKCYTKEDYRIDLIKTGVTIPCFVKGYHTAYEMLKEVKKLINGTGIQARLVHLESGDIMEKIRFTGLQVEKFVDNNSIRFGVDFDDNIGEVEFAVGVTPTLEVVHVSNKEGFVVDYSICIETILSSIGLDLNTVVTYSNINEVLKQFKETEEYKDVMEVLADGLNEAVYYADKCTI